MSEYSLGYQEVIPDQSLPVTWKDIDLNTGGTQSTLQDIKIPEKANGYCYKDTSTYLTRNRFIYWRLNNDILELIEESLDINLTGNRLKYKFRETPILDGITIHETHSNIIILVPTVSSIHRLSFPHPNILYKQDELAKPHPDLAVPSIFADVHIIQNTNSLFYVYTPPATANSQLPHAAASWLTHEEEAIFTFAYPSGDLLLVKQHVDGQGESIELQTDTIVSKLLSGMFRNKNNENVIVSMLLHTMGLETYAITLCRDGQIKVWSCSKPQCIAVSDVLISEMNAPHETTLKNIQCQLLKKVIGGDENEFMFSVYLNMDINKVFCILKPVIIRNQFTIVKVTDLTSIKGDLIDYSLTPTRILSIWRSVQGEWNVYSGQYNSEEGNEDYAWTPVVLEPLPNAQELPCNGTMDPRQLYLDYIFYPGRFPLQIISKALSIYKRSLMIPDISLSVNVLKQRVCAAVENEIHEKLQETEVTDEFYLEEAMCCWANFYSCVVQYHVAALKPLGILLLPSVSGAVLLKKASYSFLRPMDVLEHLVNCPETNRSALLGNTQISTSNEEIQDLIKFSTIFDLIDESLNDYHKEMFENNLSLSVPPMEAVEEIVHDILTEEFLHYFGQKVKSISDLYVTIHKLLELLRMDESTPDVELSKSLKSSIMYLFSSNLGTSIVSQSFSQQIATKFNICRNLLIFKAVVLKEENASNYESLRSVCKLDIEIHLNSYFALLWLTQQAATSILPLDTQNQRLCSLKFTPVFHLKNNSQHLVSLIEMYVSSNGGTDAHKDLLEYDFNEEKLAYWHTSLLPYLTRLTLLIWPVGGKSYFLEWLLSSGQHLHLQRYISLLQPWCCYGTLNQSFYAGISYLNTGEIQKAYDFFSNIFEEFSADEFVVRRVTDHAPHQALILFNLKIIQLLELHGARDYAIKAAEEALTRVDDDEPLKPTLYSIIFKHHLALGHYENAFQSLCSNPDSERKKDNLRDLVKTLLDAGHIDILMRYDYEDLEDLFLSILYTRARAIDTVENIYYDFLYAYSVMKSMWRFSASVVYEQAYRLSYQASLEALEKHVKCLLMAVNSLSLGDDQFAWVLKPSDIDLGEEEHILPAMIGSKTEPTLVKYRKQVDIIDLAGIRKELVFAKARLHLAVLEPKSISHLVTSPQELVMYLTTAGIFKTAFKLCKAYDIEYDAIFENLAYKCFELNEREEPDNWNWIMENDIHDFDYIPNSPRNMVWNMLKKYLADYEAPQLSRYHRVVTEKLLQLGDYPPFWLIASYKKRNPGELLRVFYFNGLLRVAATLALEYINAALGNGTEEFGMKHSLITIAPPMCINLPCNVIDSLIYELELQNQDNPDKPFEKEYTSLKELFIKYIDTSVRISDEMCRHKLSTMVL